MERKEKARRSDQTRRAETMPQSIAPKYITPLMIAGGAALAYPVVDSMTNMPSLEFAAMAVLAIAAAIIAGSVVESARCGRW